MAQPAWWAHRHLELRVGSAHGGVHTAGIAVRRTVSSGETITPSFVLADDRLMSD